ncbi:MAG: glycosyltransferase [Planctomycetota bacterium]
MRILHVSTRLILGGSQENTVLSCEGQSRLGHEVHLAYGPIFGPEGSMLERVTAFRSDTGGTIAPHEVPDLCRELSPIRDRRAKVQLRQLIERLKPDIVHTHSSKAGIVGRAAAWESPFRRSPGMGIVHTIHGPPFMPIEGSLARRLKVRGTNKVYEWAERYAARRCHLIISVADAMTQQFLARGIGRPEQFKTVYSGMEVDRYLQAASPGESREAQRASLGLGETDFVIGTVSRLAEHKGHDDLLSALGDDLKSHPNWKLLWVGDGWWRDRLLARARALGLADQLLTTGLVPSDRVPGLMRAMDILIHPSSREGLPRTVPQALLARVCPVAYDVDGTREACIEGETGRLVPLGDLALLREAVRSLYDAPDARHRLAQQGRELCRRRFSAGVMVAELERVYAQALSLARR